jgi:hypothetical protein
MQKPVNHSSHEPIPKTGFNKAKGGNQNQVASNSHNMNTSRPTKLCHCCASPSHLVANCPMKQSNQSTMVQGQPQSVQSPNNLASRNTPRRVNTAQMVAADAKV